MIKLKANSDIELKELGYEDIQPIFSIIDSELPYLSEWLPFVSETKTPDDTRLFVEDYLNSEGHELTFGIFYQGRLAGLIGLKDIDTGNKKTEVGYWLSEKFQHKGIVTLSCRALIGYAFETLKLNRIQLKAATGNLKSQQVAKRLGFKREGIERAGELHQRGFVDLVVFSLLKEDLESI
ncbi:MAG TPA: GNAT family protein [Paludibacter sp.]|nr:GNAT family protein [Paludibacter sp.]